MKLVLSFFVLLCCSSIYSQIEYTSKSHFIVVNNDRVIEVTHENGNVTDTEGAIISINYSGLETIEDVLLTYFDKGNKKVKEKDFVVTSLLTSSFYAGLQALQYNIKKPTKFQLSYKTTYNDLMYFSTLDFYKIDKCDSIIYELNLPSEYNLFYNIPYHIDGLQIDSSSTGLFKKYTFKLFNQDSELLSDKKKSNSNHIVYKRIYQSIRIQISKNANSNQVLNNWYLNLIGSVGVLNETSKIKIDSIIGTITDDEKIIKTLFNYVQNKIRYIDIEDGISAFQPREVNSILSNKQGDCKDMSNLLTQSLKYKGYDARIALASSLSHRFSLDFPNVASANHVVCVVKINEKWVMLDATDRYCIFLKPSSHTQNRNIFIIGKDMGTYLHIDKIPYNENLDSTYLEMSIENGIIEANVNMNMNGLASQKYYSAKDYYKNSVVNEWIEKEVKEKFKAYDINNLVYQIGEDNSSFNFTIKQKTPTITTIKNRYYLALSDILLYPHDFPIKINSDEELVTYETIYKKWVVNLKFNKSIKLIKPINTSYDNESMRFELGTKLLENNILVINCVLIIDEVDLKDKKISIYNELNKIILDDINSSIVYENFDE